MVNVVNVHRQYALSCAECFFIFHQARNPVRGPSFANLDIAVSKNFTMPWSKEHRVQFRWEAFNAFNHTNFAVPEDPTSLTNSNNLLFNPGNFGVISHTAEDARQMQFSLRYDF